MLRIWQSHIEPTAGRDLTQFFYDYILSDPSLVHTFYTTRQTLGSKRSNMRPLVQTSLAKKFCDWPLALIMSIEASVANYTTISFACKLFGSMSCSFGKLFKSHDTRKLSFFKGTLCPDVEASRHDQPTVMSCSVPEKIQPVPVINKLCSMIKVF